MSSKTAALVSRSLLGVVLVVFGLNGFLNFLPMPPAEGVAATFMGGLGASGYFFPLLKATEILIGLALLANRFVPLALVVLAPISVNIVAFHLFLAPAGIGPAAVVAALNAGVAYLYRDAFRCVLAARTDVPAPEERTVTRAATA
jgi:hypothetical protein